MRFSGTDRLLSVWRRVFDLSWPVMAEQVLRTLMRTTDVVVSGLFSPAAVAAIGLADLYARLPLRIGLGLGSGIIALSSQDTGSSSVTNRNEAITQGLVLGALAGVPFVVFGLLVSQMAIAFLGATNEVARMGGLYLSIIFASSPARHVALVGARALQGTGDTRTPMYINGVSNGLNILGTIILGLGVGPAPELSIVGVGLATAFGNVFSAVTLLAAIASPWTRVEFARPHQLVIARQLLAIAAPRITEGLVTTAMEFPFNAILLMFGTEINAGYQIGRRVYQQITAPLSRGYRTAASILVGQALGESDIAGARYAGWATALLGFVTVGLLSVALFVGADALVGLFTADSATARFATAFARTYAVAAPLTVLAIVIAGALGGGSDTWTPFIARTSGMFLGMLGISYVGGIRLGIGLPAVYASIVAFYTWMMVYVALGFYRGGWADRTRSMMAERESASIAED